MNPNPLSAYFRQPSLYLNLPSRGYWWPEGSLVMPANYELSVMSMTAGDEILLKTPDALLSGEAIVSMIQNCIPGIKDAWQMPVVDLEAVLTVIRIASVGESMTIEASCPKCQESNNYDIDLRHQLSQIDIDFWMKPLKIGKMTIGFQPLNYSQLIQYQNKIFQNQKQLQNLSKNSEYPNKDELIHDIILELNSIELESYCTCIRSITIDQITVTDHNYITEFLVNCEKKIFTEIKNHIDSLRSGSKCSDLTLICNECNYQFSSTFSMDYSNFFELGS